MCAYTHGMDTYNTYQHTQVRQHNYEHSIGYERGFRIKEEILRVFQTLAFFPFFSSDSSVDNSQA